MTDIITEGHSNAEYDAAFNAVAAADTAGDQADDAVADAVEQPQVDEAQSDDAPPADVPQWLGADVSNLTAEQIKALEQPYKTMLKGLNAKMREVAELRRQATQPQAGAGADLAEQLAKLIAAQGAPKPAEPAVAVPDADVAALLERVDDDTKPLIEQIVSLVDKRSRGAMEAVQRQLERKAIVDRVTREHNDFIAKHPTLNEDSDVFNQVEYDNFKTFVQQSEKLTPGRSLDSMWKEYDYDRVSTQAPRGVRVAPRRAVETGSSVGAGKRLSSYELYEREYAKTFGK